MKRLVCGLWAHAVSTGISRATSYTSLRNGNWDDPTIWESIPPGSGEAVDEFHGPGGDVVRSNVAAGPLRFYRLRAAP